MWDDRDSEHGGFLPYEILYFLSDDTVAVKEVHTKNNGRDPFPQLLRKTKLPKVFLMKYYKRIVTKCCLFVIGVDRHPGNVPVDISREIRC